MPVFVYTARSKTGEKVEGTLEANDRRSALLQIEKAGNIPITVTERGAAGAAKAAPAVTRHFSWHGRTDRLGTRDVLLFTAELSDLLSAGMTLGNALNSLAGRRTGRPGDTVIVSLRDEIIRGTSLSDALAKHPATFPKLYVSMIRAGEASGAVDEILKRLVEHFERIQEIKEKVLMAMFYPMIVVFLGICTLIFSVVYVLPKFEVVFRQFNQALPLPTKLLLNGSSFLLQYGWAILIIVVVAGVMINRAVHTEKGRFWWHGAVLKMPLVRGIVASAIYANFARTLGTLLANGVPVLQALGIVEQTVGNVVIGGEIRKARDRVTDGTTISGPLSAGGIFPPLMTDMLAIGEQTGDMPAALAHIARRYESELNRSVKLFTTALEPILIVVIALMVGFVAISVLMAVFNLTNGLNV